MRRCCSLFISFVALAVCNLLVTNDLRAQEFLDWGVLADVEFEEVYDEDTGLSFLEAEFGAWAKQMEGKEVTITGFVIPIDPFGTSYVVSRNPNSSCFFCGGAGPETIVGLELKPEAVRRYRTDEHLTFKGKLELNENNSRRFTYMLLEAEPRG